MSPQTFSCRLCADDSHTGLPPALPPALRAGVYSHGAPGISHQHLRHVVFSADTEYEEINAGNISKESPTEPAQGLTIER